MVIQPVFPCVIGSTDTFFTCEIERDEQSNDPPRAHTHNRQKYDALLIEVPSVSMEHFKRNWYILNDILFATADDLHHW